MESGTRQICQHGRYISIKARFSKH